MKSFFFASFLTLSSFLSEAKVTSKFGEVPMEELTMKSYARDTSAAAIILFDKGSTALINSQSGMLTYKRHVRIKIFSKEALNDWASVTFSLSEERFPN